MELLVPVVAAKQGLSVYCYEYTDSHNSPIQSEGYDSHIQSEGYEMQKTQAMIVYQRRAVIQHVQCNKCSSFGELIQQSIIRSCRPSLSLRKIFNKF